ncbi:sucrase-isomaltase, intestinal-like [Ptychodera flava]|uniref:sucrase-isomaltase, intestinal-like n=1 Tax=Ptychodera flava TaxID=63121 RepID=UPI00396A2C4D
MWCEDHTPGLNVPWCFYDGPAPTDSDPDPPVDPGCQTTIPPEQRIDCFSDGGASEPACLARGCLWCPDNTPGLNAPWCFYNETFENPFPEFDAYRVDCFPEGGGGKDDCEARGCYFHSSGISGSPWCYFPPDNRGYTIVGNASETSFGYRIDLRRSHTYTLFGGDVDDIRIDIEFQSDERLHIKIYDPNSQRFEVPLDMPQAGPKATNPLYKVAFSDDPIFTLNVTRTDTGTVIWDTSIGGLVFEDQYLQLATKLGSSSIYGFGEHEHHSFKHDLNFISHGMYSRDQPPTHTGNLYGVYPFYMSVEEDFNTHGVLLLNSNAQDVTLQPGPAITYRTIGGVLDYWLFLGPSPENVVQQMTGAVGRTFMPPYWAMGFQLSRYGYDHIDVVRTTVSRVQAYDIPLDVQYGDIDYMDRFMDFTYDTVNYAGLPEYVNQLKSEGIYYVIILDPCIANSEPPGTYPPYDEGTAMGVWVNGTDGVTPIVGKVWPPEGAVFPDYTNPVCHEWWIKQCLDFKQVISYDGLWIDMNEPANFLTGSTEGCEFNTLNNPPYKPKIFGDVLADKSLCPDFVHYAGKHYDVHSLYGWAEGFPSLEATRQATGKRSIVISRSTFPGASKTVGHWLGDNYSQWTNLHYSIIGMLEMSLFGMPYIGADICGFNGDAQYDMCLRWHQLGAFYPFARNHNGYGYREQDPAAWDSNFANNVRDILHVRYTLLPYVYTLFHQSHVNGSTVVRPVMHEFITDVNTHEIDRQFLWGPGLLISPVLEQDATSVDAYFPDARWYDYYTGLELSASNRGTTTTVNAPMEYLPLHVRGGCMLPTQQPGRNTIYTRSLPLGIIAALDDTDYAEGEIFWDDGESIDTYENGQYYHAELHASKGFVDAIITHDGYRGVDSLVWGTIRVFGVGASVSSVTVNSASHGDFSWNSGTGELTINNMNAPMNNDLKVGWV